MRLEVNGAPVEVTDGISLFDYLLKNFPPPATTYVSCDGAFIPYSAYAAHILKDAEKLTVYRLPSGG